MNGISRAIVGSVLISVTAASQSVPPGSAITVQRAVPFGTTPGKLLLLGGYLVFVDDQQPESSIVVPRGDMENLTAEDGTITIQIREPIRDRSGSSNRLIFRAAQTADASLATAWYSKAGSEASRSAPSSPSGSATESESYQARHDHLRGSCKGRLIVTPTQLNFESVDKVDHSRRWELRAIKEIELPNPYELEVKPFAGGNYKLLLDGSGMTPAAFRTLVDRVTSARSAQ